MRIKNIKQWLRYTDKDTDTQACVRETVTLWVAGEVLSQVLPALFPAGKMSLEDEDTDRPTVIVQGIEAPLSTPALWLCQQLASADTMLYICVRPFAPGGAGAEAA